MDQELQKQAEYYAQLIRDWNFRGYSPATSSNFSFKHNNQLIVSRSGVDKQLFQKEDFLICNFDGEIQESFYENSKPSAETLLHIALYQTFPDVNCVAHTHSLNAILVAEKWKKDIFLKDQELLKAFPPRTTHESELLIPVVDNSQDMKTINQNVLPKLDNTSWAYIIRRHGIYIWGEDIFSTKRHLEALEYLFEYNLRMIT